MAPPSGGDAGRLPSRDRLTRHPQEGQHRAGAERDGTRDRVPPARDTRDWIKAVGPRHWRGSVHKNPGAACRAYIELSLLERYLFSSPCLRIVDSDPKHRKTLLQFLCACLCSISGRKLGFQSTIHFERVA